jgi:hypothetical protein
VRVYDQRTRPSEPRDLIYMEYVPGGTLSEVIASLHRHANAPAADATSPALPRSGAALLEHIDQRLLEQGQVPPQDSAGRRWLAAHDWASAVAWIGFQLAQALDYAHRQGVCHRDVKPANVLLTAEAVPKLADFNVSLATGPQGADAESNFGGSLAYMSPEQLRVADAEDPFAADQIDGRSDLYGLGLVLWELWQGQRPWPAAALTATRKAASQEAASQEAANREAANQQASGRNTQTPAEDLATRPPQQVRGGSAFAAAGSLMGLVRQQQQLRRRPLPRPLADSATGRALGRVLFSVLQHDPTARPVSGAELAAGLRLALTPEAAPIFHPRPGGLRDWLLRVPVWLLAGVIILIPNIAAGAFNYWYNATEILRPIDSPALEATFGRLAMGVNAVAYPLGVVALVWFSQSVRRGLTAASTRQPVAEASIRAAWRLGMAAAMIGGSLWVLAGLIYPAVLKALHPEFSWDAAFHFFVSLVLCGGVAWTVPFFGGTAAGVLLYYPVLIAPQMHDSKFRQRIAGLKKLGGRYLIAAAMVPLLAAALLAESDNHAALLMTLAATAGGILISFAAYQRFDESFQKLQAAIANREEVISHARLSRATFDAD